MQRKLTVKPTWVHSEIRPQPRDFCQVQGDGGHRGQHGGKPPEQAVREEAGARILGRMLADRADLADNDSGKCQDKIVTRKETYPNVL